MIDRLTTSPDDMHMDRPVVIRVNNNAQTVYRVNSRHCNTNLSALVLLSLPLVKLPA